jgi:protein TonB
MAQAMGAIVGSAVAHAVIVGIAIGIAALKLGSSDRDREQVSIEVREHERPQPEPEPPLPDEPDEETSQPETVAPRPAPQQPEPEPEEVPEELPEGPPMRVVGISLEATVEGGGGPTFAVGATRMGRTAKRAARQRRATAPEVTQVKAEPTARKQRSLNRAATRIPTAKVKYTLPKRRRPRVPPYPAELRSQGLEADVTVMVTLDDNGKVTSVKLITPSRYPAFNQAARAAAQGEEFEPALRDGVPVPYTLSYTYRFRIED